MFLTLLWKEMYNTKRFYIAKSKQKLFYSIIYFAGKEKVFNDGYYVRIDLYYRPRPHDFLVLYYDIIIKGSNNFFNIYVY